MDHILIVDDDVNFRRSLVIQLELEGYHVSEARSATEALKVLDRCKGRDYSPDIVITDVRMPEMGGEEFVIKLKNKFPGVPVLVISAFNLPETLSSIPFLRKPFKIKKMIERMNELVKDHLLI